MISPDSQQIITNDPDNYKLLVGSIILIDDKLYNIIKTTKHHLHVKPYKMDSLDRVFNNVMFDTTNVYREYLIFIDQQEPLMKLLIKNISQKTIFNSVDGLFNNVVVLDMKNKQKTYNKIMTVEEANNDKLNISINKSFNDIYIVKDLLTNTKSNSDEEYHQKRFYKFYKDILDELITEFKNKYKTNDLLMNNIIHNHKSEILNEIFI